LYSSPNVIRQIKSRRMRWEVRVARMGEEKNLCAFTVGKPEGKRPLGRPGHRWENEIRMDLGDWQRGCEVDPVGLGQGLLAGCCE
jgi:hypothetical protein